MKLEDMSDSRLADYIRRYRAAGQQTGGYYPLAELLLEQHRRRKSPFPTVAVAKKIIDLSRLSPDGLCTYADLWNEFCPGQPWVGHGSSKPVANSLARVIEYCVRNQLPIITTLVVGSTRRKLSPKAISNIYEECRDLGVPVGPDPTAFIDGERKRSLELSLEALPEE